MKAALLMLCVVALESGCAFHRSQVAALSRHEDKYYADLQTTLQANRNELQAGLTGLLEVSRVRQRELLEWRRDLAKIDILLRVGTQTQGGQQSLLTEAAASDLSTLDQLLALQAIDQARLEAILKLYDAVIKAAAALQKNNQAITEYLEGDDTEYALQSLDVAALATSIADLRDLRDQLKGAEARSADAKAADARKLQEHIEKVQTALLEGLKATEHK